MKPTDTELCAAALATIFETTEHMMFVKNTELVYVAASPAFIKMAGFSEAEEILGRMDSELFPGSPLAARYTSDDRKLLAGGEHLINFIEPITDEEGRARYSSTSKYCIAGADGAPIGILGISRELTAGASSEPLLEESGEQIDVERVDPLTSLLNRAYTLKSIEQILRREGANGQHALFLIDIDRFQEINEASGHQIGDQLLAHLAEEIRNCFWGSDIVGRIGGDEFCVLMKHIADRSVIEARAHLLLTALSGIQTAHGHIALTGSIGISLAPEDGADLDTLHAKAEEALYRAKSLGVGQVAFAS